ncbi:MAG TPA: right-handed parallel beta-helix repeat-containing protein [Patescibacteria group bacterium]|nr:right-handed parallel beta-helix repeat-containing protein [Patescibacteria group bacterium]
MAFPVILVNASTGSDASNISGAGPGTPVQGTAAATDVAGTTVTVDAGTNISGVAIDGSAAIYIHDTTAGHRRWSKITGSAGSGGATPTFTVAEAYTGSLSGKTWGVGGIRASIGGADSKLLVDNNAAAGDAMPGWSIELQSAHSETIAATFDVRRAGDSTSGPITLRGTAGAGTRPLLTFSNNGNCIMPRAAAQVFRAFELRNTNATKTLSVAFQCSSSVGASIIDVKVAHSTNKFWKGVVDSGTGYTLVRDCEFGYCANVAAELAAAKHFRYLFNYIHDCGATAGLSLTATGATAVIYGNVCYNNTGDGLRVTTSSVNAQGILIAHNTFDANTSDGIEFSGANVSGYSLINNIHSNNGGYGLNFSATTDVSLIGLGVILLGSDFYNNSSGPYNPTPLTVSENEQTLDPTYTNAAGADFSIGTNLKAKGYPVGGTLAIGTGSSTYSYVDPGAAQRQEASASTIAIAVSSPIVISAGGRVGY